MYKWVSLVLVGSYEVTLDHSGSPPFLAILVLLHITRAQLQHCSLSRLQDR